MATNPVVTLNWLPKRETYKFGDKKVEITAVAKSKIKGRSKGVLVRTILLAIVNFSVPKNKITPVKVKRTKNFGVSKGSEVRLLNKSRVEMITAESPSLNIRLI